MDCLWRGLSTEGNLRFKIDRASLIAEVNLPFGKYKPRGGGLYLERRFNGGFFALLVWEAYIWRGLFSEFCGILIAHFTEIEHFPPEFFQSL